MNCFLITGIMLIFKVLGTPTVHKEDVYAVNITKKVPYAQALYCHSANFTQKDCNVVNLTLDIFTPVYNTTTKTPLPTSPKPVYLAIHGGSYRSGGTGEQYKNAEYFARRGWLGISISYRLCNGGINTKDELGTLVCKSYGNFPAHPPFGNSTCGPDMVPTFGLFTPDGCPLSQPPVNHSSFNTLLSWMYPAMRDAKAAIRWVRANSQELNIDADFITASGSSAGACSVVGLATVLEEDYKAELTLDEDPTLISTNMHESSSIATGIIQWGGDYVPIFTQLRDPLKRSRYTSKNTPLATYHGDKDGVINISMENTMKEAYAKTGVPYEQHILQGWGHDANDAPVTLPNGKNQSQHENMFEFITKIQKLTIVTE